jgi:hypothetical protein
VTVAGSPEKQAFLAGPQLTAEINRLTPAKVPGPGRAVTIFRSILPRIRMLTLDERRSKLIASMSRIERRYRVLPSQAGPTEMTIEEIYNGAIKPLPPSERFRLAILILNEIPPASVVDAPRRLE